MRKLIGITLSLMFLGIVVSQVQYVSAKSKEMNEREENRMLTSPLTSPCKPGWGYGDKNHCHTGPPGLSNGHSENKAERHSR